MIEFPPNFTYQELIHSNYATRHGIDNECPDELLDNLRNTAWKLQDIRDVLSNFRKKATPIMISSGYRCPELNKAIGGSSNSDHMRAMAADIRTNALTPYELAVFIKNNFEEKGWKQLILEYDRWIHISFDPHSPPRNQLLTIRNNAQGKRVVLHGIVGI